MERNKLNTKGENRFCRSASCEHSPDNRCTARKRMPAWMYFQLLNSSFVKTEEREIILVALKQVREEEMTRTADAQCYILDHGSL